MQKVVLILALMFGFEAFAGEAPEKFQNPIFNNKLYSGGKKVFSHDILITPTYITDYDDNDSDAKCEYITEDEKGILLKCNYFKLLGSIDYIVYEMFYARYKTDWTSVDGTKQCNVWNCSYEVKEGKIEAQGANAPSALESEIYNCAEEKDSFHDFPTGGPKMNCLDELKLRGWDKYIPGKWIKKINTWQ